MLINEVNRHYFIFNDLFYSGINSIQESYLALIKPYWEIIMTSYRLVLQVLCEVNGKFLVGSNWQNSIYSDVCAAVVEWCTRHLVNICREG
jgi:hypothetical protein